MYIGRKQDGSIYGMWTSKQPNDADHQGIEEVADDHPDLLAFLAPKPAAKQETVADIKAALIAKGILKQEDVDTIKNA